MTVAEIERSNRLRREIHLDHWRYVICDKIHRADESALTHLAAELDLPVTLEDFEMDQDLSPTLDPALTWTTQQLRTGQRRPE